MQTSFSVLGMLVQLGLWASAKTQPTTSQCLQNSLRGDVFKSSFCRVWLYIPVIPALEEPETGRLWAWVSLG